MINLPTDGLPVVGREILKSYALIEYKRLMKCYCTPTEML